MIKYNLDKAQNILYVRPQAALEKEDFVQLAHAVDPHIENTAGLSGLVIVAPQFPGWDSLGTMAAHFRFVKDHQNKIKRVALVTDSALGDVAEHLASHFVSAEIKHFPGNETATAKQWITSQYRSG